MEKHSIFRDAVQNQDQGVKNQQERIFHQEVCFQIIIPINSWQAFYSFILLWLSVIGVKCLLILFHSTKIFSHSISSPLIFPFSICFCVFSFSFTLHFTFDLRVLGSLLLNSEGVCKTHSLLCIIKPFLCLPLISM
jgi:hypothetical protein